MEGSKKNNIVATWLIVLAFMIVVMVSLGGITRLSKAGLAIVEWRPITGIIPPLTQKQWEEEFEKYKKIPQYRRLMFSISFQDFKKTLYFGVSAQALGEDDWFCGDFSSNCTFSEKSNR